MAKKATNEPAAISKPKHSRPKVMLIDCPEGMATELRGLGYSTTAASFGRTYKVQKGPHFRPALTIDASLRGLTEQEVLVIDLTNPPEGAAPDQASVAVGVSEPWVKCASGLIDPRPRTMRTHHEYFDRILAHGGQFIIFASSRSPEEYVQGHLTYRDTFEAEAQPYSLDNWAFLSIFGTDYFEISFDSGTEMSAPQRDNSISKMLLRHTEHGSFECKFRPTYSIDGASWTTLLVSKYGDAVAGALRSESSRATVFLLPDFESKAAIVASLLTEHLPSLNPALFPEIEGARWVHRDRYELPSVVALNTEIEATRKAAEETIQGLTARIESEQESRKDWYTLLRGTDRELVQAVICTLGRLGFKTIVDVDDADPNPPGGRREDVQIHDRSPVLVVDIKGIRGNPDDAESTQSEKHARMRMREWNRVDVQPLTIVNHFRHLPPDERDERTYRQEIIDNAAQTQLGLLTTWDLWRIARNAERFGWPEEPVKDIFYRTGRIDIFPSHYREIGRVAKVWKHAFGVVPAADVEVGAKMSLEVEDTFVEFSIAALRVNDKVVQVASAGSNCGVSFEATTTKLREGARVFLVQGASAAPPA